MPITSTNGVCECLWVTPIKWKLAGNTEKKLTICDILAGGHWAHNLYLWTVIRLGSSSSSKAAHIIIILNSSSRDINQHTRRLHIPISNKQTHRLAHNGDKLHHQQQQQLTSGHCSEICKCAPQTQSAADNETQEHTSLSPVCVYLCDVRWVTPLLNLGSVSIGAHRETQTTHSRQIALCLLQSSTKSQTESNRAR